MFGGGNTESQPKLAAASPPAVAAPKPAPAATVPPAPGEPEDERQFVALVQRYSKSYVSAQNDMIRGLLRPQRATAICELKLGSVSGWYGTVYNLRPTNGGKGILAVTIAHNITLSTTDSEFTDWLGMRTLIPVGSTVYAAVMALKEGERIHFNGKFEADRSDCLEETSVTEAYGMVEPTFLFQFSSISPEE